MVVWTISWKPCTVETASRRIWDWLLRVPSQGYHHFHYDSLNLSRPNISQHQLMTWITHTETLRLMDEILHHLECMKPYKSWDIYHINFCRISSINSMYLHLLRLNIPCIFRVWDFCQSQDWWIDNWPSFENLAATKSWKKHTPASSKWPFDAPNEGHLSHQKVTYRSKRGHFEEPGSTQLPGVTIILYTRWWPSRELFIPERLEVTPSLNRT